MGETEREEGSAGALLAPELGKVPEQEQQSILDPDRVRDRGRHREPS